MKEFFIVLGSIFLALIVLGGIGIAFVAVRGNALDNYSVTSIGATWAARCNDSLGAAVLLEVSLVRVLPKPGKCVSLAGF